MRASEVMFLEGSEEIAPAKPGTAMQSRIACVTSAGNVQPAGHCLCPPGTLCHPLQIPLRGLSSLLRVPRGHTSIPRGSSHCPRQDSSSDREFLCRESQESAIPRHGIHPLPPQSSIRTGAFHWSQPDTDFCHPITMRLEIKRFFSLIEERSFLINLGSLCSSWMESTAGAPGQQSPCAQCELSPNVYPCIFASSYFFNLWFCLMFGQNWLHFFSN